MISVVKQVLAEHKLGRARSKYIGHVKMFGKDRTSDKLGMKVLQARAEVDRHYKSK